MAKKKTLNQILRLLDDNKELKDQVKKHETAHKEVYKDAVLETDGDYKTTLQAIAQFIKQYKEKTDGTKMTDKMAINAAHEFMVAYGKQVLDNPQAKDDEALAVALDLAKDGKLGDLYGAYHRNERSGTEQSFSSGILREEIDPFDFEHKTSLANDYLVRKGHLLDPDELKKLKALPPEGLAHKAVELLGSYQTAKKMYKKHARSRSK